MSLESTEGMLDGDPNNDPECVEYWVIALDMASGNRGMAQQYAELVHLSADEFLDTSPEELAEMYKGRGWSDRARERLGV